MNDHAPLTNDEINAIERNARQGYADPEDTLELVADLREARAWRGPMCRRPDPHPEVSHHEALARMVRPCQCPCHVLAADRLTQGMNR